MLEVSDVQRIIDENHFPGAIVESGRTWVKLELTDPSTGLGRLESRSFSGVVDLVLHWREHGCHEHPCPMLILREHQT
jgi:hypothetical protein